MATKYHEKNVHSQCVSCNHFNSGEQFKYSIRLDDVYGEGTAKELLEMSKTMVKKTDAEIKELQKLYLKKSKEEAKKRNINL